MIDQSNRSGWCLYLQLGGDRSAACVWSSSCLSALTGQAGPYSPEGAALGGYGLDGQAHLGLRTAGNDAGVQ